MLAEGVTPDFIIVDGAEGGTAAAPLEYEDHVGLPLTDGLMTVHNALVGAGLRGDIRIGASGKVATGNDIVKRLIQGADYTNAARAMMMAVGCIQSQRCHTNHCPVGVATQDPRRARALDVADKSERVYRYQKATVEEAMRLMGSMGVTDPAMLSRTCCARERRPPNNVPTPNFTNGCARVNCSSDAPRSWRSDWEAADPDSFVRSYPISRSVMTTVASTIVNGLADLGVRQVWGVVGDALNPITEAIRLEDRIEWVGVRHEEVAAFAAAAQAQLSGTLGVCMGTVGPGSLHLFNGLYDAKKSHAPVLAICGQVPTSEIGSNFFQEVDNNAVFANVCAFHATVTAGPDAVSAGAGGQRRVGQARRRGVDRARRRRRTRRADGSFALAGAGNVPGTRTSNSRPPCSTTRRKSHCWWAAAPARRADEVLEVAKTLAAPMVLTLKAKEGLEHDNPYQVGQSGLIGNPAAHLALHQADTLFLVGTDFPYRDWLPHDKKVVQLDTRPEHIGRRVSVAEPLVGDAKGTLTQLLPLLKPRTDTKHLDRHRREYELALRAAAAHRARSRPQIAGPGAQAPGQSRRADPPGIGGRRDQRRRRRQRHLHHRHRDGDGVVVPVRRNAWRAKAVGVFQSRFDGQRHAAGARRRGTGPLPPSDRVLR